MIKNMILGMGLVLIFGTSSVESAPSTIPLFMYNAANAWHLDVALLYAICSTESKCKASSINHNDGTHHARAQGKSVKSFGLFQIQLGTARALGFRGTYDQLMTPSTNAYYAAKLLRQHYLRYHSYVKAISAYNAGHYTPSNQAYVNAVLQNYAHYKMDKGL